MRKALSLILVLVMTASMFTFNVFAAEEIKVTIDGKAQIYDVMPIIENGRTLVPMRAIFEALGAEVAWDDATKTVTGKKADISVSLQIGNTSVKVNEKEVTLDVPAKILEGRTLVPVRFISETLGCNVAWEDSTKTVIINSSSASQKTGLATLKSTFHRPVPTEFEKSNDPSDLLYFNFEQSPEEQEALYKQFKDLAEVVCTEEEYLNGKTAIQGSQYGSDEIVDVEGMPFKKALRITCTTVPEKSASFISRTTATPRGGVSKTDKMLFVFRLRTVSGGNENGVGKVQVQIQHPETYSKAVFEFAEAGTDWKVIYMPFEGKENATDIGIRAGFYNQVVEVGGIEILKFPDDFDLQQLPQSMPNYDEFNDGAAWREEALLRIEKIRKGDFTVIVKDAAGNVIPNAEVELDMFEHEFEFGNAMNVSIVNKEDYRSHAISLFNAAVLENGHKWAPYEDNPGNAKNQVDAITALGFKYLRGHSIFWERDLGSDGKSYLTPEYVFTDEMKKPENKHLYDEKAKAHTYQIVKDHLGIVHEWDVINEIVSHTKVRDVFGPEIYKDAFKWAREAGGEDTKLYYNEAAIHDTKFFERLDELTELGVDFDAIGLQSHYDAGRVTLPSTILKLYEDLQQYDKELKVTEFSASMPNSNIQGNIMRDTMICAFAEERMNGFLMWGFWDGANFRSFSPVYDKDWNLKPGGRAYIDLVYNKWWTKDAKAVTNAEGKATIRGFYGDYDITVNANGKTVTDMVAFHKGYDNILEIVVE